MPESTDICSVSGRVLDSIIAQETQKEGPVKELSGAQRQQEEGRVKDLHCAQGRQEEPPHQRRPWRRPCSLPLVRIFLTTHTSNVAARHRRKPS